MKENSFCDFFFHNFVALIEDGKNISKNLLKKKLTNRCYTFYSPPRQRKKRRAILEKSLIQILPDMPTKHYADLCFNKGRLIISKA
jgi:hypothetical protein